MENDELEHQDFKICEYCKNEFIAKKTTSKTYSDDCAKRLYKLKHRNSKVAQVEFETEIRGEEISKFKISFAYICQYLSSQILTMATQFGDKIRTLRTKQKMLLRHVASALDIDTALLSKIERGGRIIKKEQISLIAQVLRADKEELLTLWLADQVYDVLKDEKQADEALKSVSKKLKKPK